MDAWVFAMLVLVLVFGSAVAIVGILTYAVVRLMTGRAGMREAAAEESRLVQEVYQGLLQMERRMESLETLLYDRMDGEKPHDR